MTYKNRAPFPSALFVETQRNFTSFDKSLSSGLTDAVISSPGDFLYIDQASTGYVYVELNHRQAGPLAPVLLAAGGSIECDFVSVKLYAPAQLGKTVRVIIGNGARVKSGGNVNPTSSVLSVVDGGKERTKNDRAFIGTASISPAGTYDHVQLWNPSTSGRSVFVEQIEYWINSTTATLALGYNTTALATLIGTANSKRASGTASSSQLRSESNAGYMYTSTWRQLSADTTTRILSFKEPVQVDPGIGLLLGNLGTGKLVTAVFEFFEE